MIFGAAVRAGGIPSQALCHRVDAACAFGRAFPGALYVPTGGVGRHGPAEAVVMARLLAENGVAHDRICMEETGTDTLSSVRAVACLLKGWTGPVFAVSSSYHLPRCVLLLRMAGLAARAAPPSAAKVRNEFYWGIREAIALPYDALLMLLGGFLPNPFSSRREIGR